MNAVHDAPLAPAGKRRALWRQVGRAWVRHVLHPVPRADVAPAAPPWKLLLALLSIATPLALAAAIVVSPFGDDVGLRSRLDFRFNALEALLVLVIAPCVEEFVFRGPLGSRRAFERGLVLIPPALAAGLAVLVVVRTVPWLVLKVALPAVVLIAAVAAALWLDDWLERRRFTRTEAAHTLFARHFAWIVHLSTLAFALSHAVNYALAWDTLWFLPLAVLPQLVLGYACVFMRAARGLRWAMLLHAAHNVIAYTLAALAQ